MISIAQSKKYTQIKHQIKYQMNCEIKYKNPNLR